MRRPDPVARLVDRVISGLLLLLIAGCVVLWSVGHWGHP